MIGRTNLGGSGAGLNFKVVGGTSAPAGHENLIWVNSSTPITNWVVSPNQPENPTEGMVWIADGNQNGINILRKNTVEVFPSGCKQWIGGSWKWVDAYLFLNGSWTQFSSNRLYLFSAHNLHDEVTGGWSSEGYRQMSASPSGGAGFDGPSIYCTGKYDSWDVNNYEGANGTGRKVDMRSCSTLYVDCVSTTTANAIVFICSEKNNFQVYALATAGISTTRSVIAVDVSNVDEGYVVFTSQSYSRATSRVYEMWLE